MRRPPTVHRPILLMATALVLVAPVARAADTDGDGVDDAVDNCTLVANASQLDADGDGIGNACDADLDQNGSVSATDFALLRSVLGQSASANATAAAADLDGSGTVTATDYAIFRRYLGGPPGPAAIRVTISPRNAALTTSQAQQFAATVKGSMNHAVTWKVDGIAGGNSTVGTVDTTGRYVPPAAGGTHGVTATSQANGTSLAAVTVAVTDLAAVATWRNDVSRTGQNRQEYALSPATVTPASFGRLYSCAVQGQVYAQPLYVANLAIGGGTHNVLFVATEGDQVYALDADAPACTVYWQANLIPSGATTVPANDTGEVGDLYPEIGITSTPVIDVAGGTIYVLAKTREADFSYAHRLHALALGTGAERFGGPVVITGSVTGNGTGHVGSTITFDPLIEHQRAALVLAGGIVYIGWGSHGDLGNYHGWLIGYNATSLARTSVYNVTPNGYEGSIWMTGAGPAVDAAGDLYVITANGKFDTSGTRTNYGDSFLRLNLAGGLHVADFFTPFDQATLDANDIDLGSGGNVLLPAGVGSTTHPNLLIGTGKTGLLYLVDRAAFGGYKTNGPNQIVQQAVVGAGGTVLTGNFSTPAVWQDGAATASIYVAPVADHLKRFTVTNGQVSTSAASISHEFFDYPGATPAVSSLGNAGGIVWAVDTSLNASPNPGFGPGPAVLRAYDGTNLQTLLYDSSVRTGDAPAGTAIKFVVPTIANGRVYVGTDGEVSAYGLLP